MSGAYFEYGQKETDYLKKRDKKLGAYIEKRGNIERKITPDLFSALTDSIISQQISSKAAETVYKKLAQLCEITPNGINSLSCEQIQKCGTSMRKAEYIKNAAEAVLSKKVDIERFPEMTDAQITEALISIKGVGVWTAEMMLIFSLVRMDVVSYGDLAIRRGMMNLYSLKELSKDTFMKYRKRYSPYGTVASLYLWDMS